MNIKDLESVLIDITENRMISYDVVMTAITEGLSKASAKHVDNIYPLKTSKPGEKKENKVKREIQVRVDIADNGDVKLYHQRTATNEEITDPAINISVADAKKIDPKAKEGTIIEDELKIEEFGRNAVFQMKNIMLQQIKEANKQMVYNEYIDKIDDMVVGTVQTVEDKFALIDLGKTIAIMTKGEQIPGERYYDGQRLKVVIKSVSKDPKAAQVVVSRSSANLVKRLFESSVTEIYDGTVEIKAIAREANERTKMAVYSNNANVDPIGACIGPRGARVLAVIEEITQSGNPLSHENIDIFEWSPNYVEFVKNAMKPANVIAVFPQNEEDDSLFVVVDDDQLSLAIGKRGINARLAVRLLNRKIDIKTRSEIEAEGIDWFNESLAFEAKQEALRKQKAIEELTAQQEAAAAAEQEESVVEQTIEPEVEQEASIDNEVTEVQEPVVVEEPEVVEEVVKRRKANLEKAKASEYVSKYEDLADAKKSNKQETVSKRKKVTKEDEEDAELKKKLEELKQQEYSIKPEYSDEELEEFNNDDDDHWYDDDVDYDDYDEFYDN